MHLFLIYLVSKWHRILFGHASFLRQTVLHLCYIVEYKLYCILYFFNHHNFIVHILTIEIEIDSLCLLE